MCVETTMRPFILPLVETTTRTGETLRTESLLLGKVTTLRNREHISFKGLLYPLLQPVHDTKAIVGDHQKALHFAATPECTIGLPDEFGSHKVAVLPSRQVWAPYTNEIKKPRCWHADGCIPLFCLSCWNLTPDDLQNPDFWQCFKTYCAKNGDFLRTLSLDQIWQRQIVVSDNES
jgi:hypothetical protein